MSTYLVLVNKLLRRFNEVELNSSTFGSAKGVHGLAKDGIIFSLNQINQQQWKWPFNYVDSGTVYITGTIGQESYDYPTLAEDIDLDNIFIKKDDTLSVNAAQLRHIDHDEYKRNLRVDALNSFSASTYNIPIYVTRSPEAKMIVHPKPDKAYVFIVPHWIIPTEPSLYSDTVTVPSRFDDVIVNGAVWYLHMQRGNEQGATLDKESKFEKDVKRMRTLLINQTNSMSDTRVPSRSGRSSSTKYINA